jgi:hypothetical protein
VACRSEFVTADAAGGVRVLPLDRSSVGGLAVDIARSLRAKSETKVKMPRAIASRSIFGEPDLDLVEPGGVSGREVKPDSRMLLEELANRLSFVCGEIVEDDVNLLLRGGHKDTTSCKKAMNSRLVWRAAVLPWTRPVAVLSAAYKESVPWR